MTNRQTAPMTEPAALPGTPPQTATKSALACAHETAPFAGAIPPAAPWRRALRFAAVLPIHFYRLCISPLFPPTCRFQPTCSQYALIAIQTHGVLKGGALAARRIGRCHPISWLGGSSGFDPVPPVK